MTKRKLTPEVFDKLSDAEKERIYGESESLKWEDATPLTAAERREWESIKRGPGRPKRGQGASVVSLSIEKDLLKAADTFAKAHGLSRSEVFARGLRAVMVASGAA